MSDEDRSSALLEMFDDNLKKWKESWTEEFVCYLIGTYHRRFFALKPPNPNIPLMFTPPISIQDLRLTSVILNDHSVQSYGGEVMTLSADSDGTLR